MTDACWLVDIGHVVKSARERFKLDYIRARYLLVTRYGQTSAFLFNGVDPAYGIPPGLQRFYDSMTQHGMTVRLQPMQSGPPGTNRQRRVDVDIAAHLVWAASVSRFTSIVLTAGDQDFVPALEIARREFQKQIILFTYSSSAHSDLAAIADEWIRFEDYKEDISSR